MDEITPRGAIPPVDRIPPFVSNNAANLGLQIAAMTADYEAAHFAAIQASMMSVRNMAAILASPIRLLRLTPGLLELLGIKTRAEFALYAAQGRHTEVSHPGSLDPAMRALRGGQLTHVSPRSQEGSRLERRLVMQSANGSGAFLVLKFLAATATASGSDECWVKTLFEWGATSIGRALRNGKIRPVFQHERNALGEIRVDPL